MYKFTNTIGSESHTSEHFTYMASDSGHDGRERMGIDPEARLAGRLKHQ